MLRGIYSAGTAMLTQQKKMNVITNNISNARTTGFKQDNLISRSFKDMMISAVKDSSVVSAAREVGPYNTGIHVDQVLTNFDEGGISQTKNDTDFAIAGEGYFVVDTPQGRRYTRDGAFGVTSEGYLVNGDGYPVEGSNGRIYVGQNDFSVNEQGDITVNDAIIGRMRVVNINSANLRKEGNNLYTTVGNPQITQSNAKIKQGYLEESNVDVVDAMVQMLNVYRNYESNQRMIKIQDNTLEKTVNEIGKV